MARSAAGADRERRRLSISFQRPISGSGVFGVPSLALRRKPKIQGNNCQSPRTQRCWRAAATVVAGRKFLDDLDVGRQAGAREYAFQQIVAEDRVFGNLAFQRRFEDVDFVDPLAAIGAFFEQILIDVGNRERIGIQPVGAGKHALEQRSFAADGQRRRHARLKNAVTVHDHAATADRSAAG